MANGRIEREGLCFSEDSHLADLFREAERERERKRKPFNWGPIVIFLGSALAATIYVAGYYWRTR